MAELVTKLAGRPGGALAGWRGMEPVSAEALLARVSAWRALALRTPGEQVALYLADSLEFGAALLGAWQAGKTVWLSADTLEGSCTALATSVSAFFGEFPAQFEAMTPSDGDACPLPWLALDPAFDALVVFTSGSSGAPQAIPKRMSQLNEELETLETLFGARVGDADVIATVSHQHIYGLLFKVLWPLTAGRAIHAHSLDYPEQIVDVLQRRDCVLVASPAHLKRLPETLDWSAVTGRLRCVFSSGGPLLPEGAAAAMRLLGQAPVEIYGSSETGGIAWRCRELGGAGAWEPVPGAEWRIDDATGQLEVRSRHLPDDNWMLLQDRVTSAGANRFLLLGRSDRLVKIEEKRVSLDAIEAALLASGLALEARVIVCPERGGARQQVAAFVVASNAGKELLASGGKLALNNALRAWLTGRVEPVAMPRRWRYLDQLPVNAQGKTTHAQLLALLGETDQRPRMPQMTVLEEGPVRVLLELTVPATLFYFDGHFAQAPVLPGVVQVDWAIHYGRRYFALAPAFNGMNALKFQQVIRPEQPVRLELSHDGANGSLSFRYFSDAGQHASGRVLFVSPP